MVLFSHSKILKERKFMLDANGACARYRTSKQTREPKVNLANFLAWIYKIDVR